MAMIISPTAQSLYIPQSYTINSQRKLISDLCIASTPTTLSVN